MTTLQLRKISTLFFLVILQTSILASCGHESAKKSKVLDFLGRSSDGAIWNEPLDLLRQKISLDGKWSFAPEGYAAREVDVPCFWEAIADPKMDVQCPGYLDRTIDQGLTAFEFDPDTWEKRKIHRGNYAKTLDIPPGYEVAKIWFDSIHHKADVFLNDQKIGTHTGPYLKVGFDASSVIKPGQNFLRVNLTDGTSLMQQQNASQNIIKKLGLRLGRRVVEKINPSLRRPIPDYPVGNYSYADATGLYRSVSLELLPSIFVEDVFIVPSVRRSDLTIEVAIHNTKQEPVTIWLNARAKPLLADHFETVWEASPQKLDIPPAATIKTVLVEPWTDTGNFWSPQNPYLYYLETVLTDSENKPIDFKRDRFGFREIWIENGDYILNGEKVNLLGDSINVHTQWKRFWAKRYLSCETARETFLNLRRLNINFVRFHGAPPENCVHDIADELGFLTLAESAIHARMETFPPFSINESFMSNAKNWLSAWVKEKRNHPSIIMWSVENEMFLYGMPMFRSEAFSLGASAKAQDSILRPDGVATAPRPISWDGDSSFIYRAAVPKRVDMALWFDNIPSIAAAIHDRLNSEDASFPVETLNWHYPYDRWNTTDPEKEWFDKPIDHLQPYFVPELPTGIGEIMFDRRHKLDQLPGVTFSRVKAMEAQVARAARIIGYDDVRPFQLHWAWQKYDPTGGENPYEAFYHHVFTKEENLRLTQLITDSYHPIAVFDYDYTNIAPNQDGTFGPVALAASATATRILVVMNDSFVPDRPITVDWEVFDHTEQRKIAGSSFLTIIKQGSADRNQQVVFQTPTNGHRLKLIVKSHMEGLSAGDFSISYDFITKNPETM